ncbi:MAG: TetR/AcrR family transcriptional regulator [Lachnospiraceae bacterium]
MEKKLDLRVQKTYDALSNTFLALLSEKDFADITVNELCERAMIRRATFYTHFSDKYDFFAFFMRQIEDSFYSDYEKEKQYKEENDTSYFLYMLKETIDFLNAHKKIVEKALASNAFPTITDILSNVIYENVLENLSVETIPPTQKEASPEILAAFYSGGIVHLLKYWLNNRNTITEEELIAEVKKMF